MSTTNITCTIIPYALAPIHIENGWDFICFNENVNAFRSTGDGSVMLKKGGLWPVRESDGCDTQLVPKREEPSGVDILAPLFRSATIAADGSTVTVVFNENIALGPGSKAGMGLTLPSGFLRLTFKEINANNNKQVFYTTPRPILQSEVPTLLYNQPGGGLADAAGNSVVSFKDQPVINSSALPAALLRAEPVTRKEPTPEIVPEENEPIKAIKVTKIKPKKKRFFNW